MKKILTVSLFAMMAVSAANAEIASTDYVGKQITATAGTLGNLTTTEKTNLVGAINEVRGQLTSISEEQGSNLSAVEQSVSDLSDVVDGKADKATTLAGYGITDAMTATAINSAISTATTDMATNTGVAASIKEVTDVMATDTELSDAVSALEEQIEGAGANTTALAGRVTTAEGEIDALQSGKADKATTLAGYGIADAMTATAINSAISTATTDMATNTGVAASIKEVTDVMATDTELSTAVNAKQDKSTALSVGAADGEWTDLTKATGYSTTGTHSLVLKNGTIQWEAVSY